LKKWTKKYFPKGFEFLSVTPAFICCFLFVLWLSAFLQKNYLGGDFIFWLSENFGVAYDQRNAIIISFALGFAVIPIIFTMTDEALSSFPKNLKIASLALGATHWQTLMRVVLPTTASGIFAGFIIGFGRAIGETMIVLMATGNSPITSWSFFNGMRTISANIAVEIPEAPIDGTLYRLLFLSAILLFMLTFILNLIAELIRGHLRKKYRV
jgi:phosphate transport system permease protein